MESGRKVSQTIRCSVHTPANNSLTCRQRESKQVKVVHLGMRRLLLLVLLLWTVRSWGQVLPGPEETQQNLIEGLFEDYGDDDGGEIQPEWLLLLEDLLHRPLDINTANEQDLRVFFFLESAQIDAIIAQRQQFGLYLHPLELQVVPGIDPMTLRRLMPFIRAGIRGDGTLERAHYWQTGRREFTLRMERGLEQKLGYLPRDDGSPPPYAGDPNRLVGRLRYFSGNKISYGISFEKDAGEAFFTGNNRQGFDFYSVHLFIRKPFKGCNQLLLGDFGLNLGQGLLVSTGFNSGKTAAVTMIKRVQRNIFPMNSWQESRFFRGAAAEWQLSKRFQLLTFASLRNRDGNVVEIDTSFSEISLQVSSFQQSGFHRTASEIANKGAFREFAAGAGITFRQRHVKIGVQGAHFLYDPVFQPATRPYSQFYFRGASLSAASMDYQATVRNLQLFGEAAVSHNGGFALSSGLLSSPDRKMQFALLARHFSRDYWNVWGAPLAESFIPRNESGLYAGMILRPVYGWRLYAFADMWHHPWFTFQSDSPVRGAEQLFRVEYEQRRQWQFYLQFRRKARTVNQSGSREVPDQVPTFRQQWRAQIQYDLNRIMSLRTRVEWSEAGTGNTAENGFLLAQDFLYKPVGSRWSATMRYAIFHTDGYASRIYMFENDLLYTFGLRPYYHHGQRFYLNLRFRPWNNLTLEGRYEIYRLFNQTEIGSGNERIDGPVRSGVKAQIRWLF